MSQIKAQVLHQVRLHLKVPCWLLVSHLNEMSGGRGNMWFNLIAENFEVFGNDIFHCKVSWMVAKGEWNSIGSFVL